MWLFTKNGFFSAVQHFQNKDIIHVRARFTGDLDRLCKEYGIETPITKTPDNDYLYRADFTREQWSDIVRKEAEKIDYPNFKDAVHDGTGRDSAYLKCWSALREQQQ